MMPEIIFCENANMYLRVDGKKKYNQIEYKIDEQRSKKAIVTEELRCTTDNGETNQAIKEPCPFLCNPKTHEKIHS